MFFRKAANKFSALEIDYLKLHKDDTLKELSGYMGKSVRAIKNQLLVLDGKTPLDAKKSGQSKKGKRKDLDGLYVRSGWEANVCRYLKSLGIQYVYEPKTYSFIEHGHVHGTVSYTVDFLIINKDGSTNFLEIKGFCDKKDMTRIKRFQKYYPVDFARLQAITGSPTTKATEFFKSMNIPIYKYYNDLNKECKGKIEFWE